MRRQVLALVAAVVAAGGCGSDGGGEALRPQVDQIVPAIEAVEAARGGPQEFFEVNATPQLVNVFVAVDAASAVVAYVWIDGELGPASAAEPAEGITFTAADLDLDADAVLDPTLAELPGGDLTAFAVEGASGGDVRYSIRVTSERGGELEVVVGPSGEVRSVEPL